MSLTRKKIIFGALIVVILGGCLLLLSYAGSRFRKALEPSPEQTQFTFRQHILHYTKDATLAGVSEIQVRELSMGQGVYIRFRSEESFIRKMLEDSSAQHSYKPIDCDEFFNAYPADTATSIEWWRPQEVIAPTCYQAEVRRYLLIDGENGIVYYYSFPDFLG
jgi:hypothetical protein